MKRLSTVVFNPDTTLEAEQLMMKLRPLMNASDGDYLEMSVTERTTEDAHEVTIHVIAHTGDILGLVDGLCTLDLI